jgi:hypothetical protein
MGRTRQEVLQHMHESRKIQSRMGGERSGRSNRLALLLPILPILVGGCIGPTEAVESLIWEGTLQPVAGAAVPVTGSVAIVSGQFNTQIGIGVEGVDPGTVLQWNVRRGDCDEEGEPLVNLSVFPPIEVGNTGEVSSGVVWGVRISTPQNFAARVSLADAEASTVACALLARRD